MRQPTLPSLHHQRLLATASLWLAAGSVLLLTTLVPAHTNALGWAPLFWLAGAPSTVLLALEPTLPRQLLARCRSRRRARCLVPWH